MRDGVHLFTAVYVPKDASPQKRYPILLTRTPYGVAPYGADQYLNLLGPDESFGLEGFVFAYQDVRGTNASEGKFVDVRPEVENKRGSNKIDESSDTYDTVDWLVKHIANNNGKVGLWGVSYPGFYAAAGAIDAHPAVVCVSPQAPVSDWFMGDDFHHNGALYLAHAFNFFSTFGVPRPVPVLPKHDFTNRGFDYGTEDGYQFYLNLGPLKNANEKYFKNNVNFILLR